MKRPILIILHQETSTPGRVGHRLAQRGYSLDIRRPRFGDPLPETMDGHSGAIIFGGPMSANDPDEFVRREIDWISVPLSEGAPFLGICLGAQMLARQLGATVSPREDGHVEIGYYPLFATEAGRTLCDWPDVIYQWHREGFTLPSGADCLATSALFECQAFAYGRSAFAFQFHIELTLAMMHRWTVQGAERFTLPGAQHGRLHLDARHVHDHATSRFLDAFLDLWLGEGRAELARTA